jgi:Nitroreductase family
MSAADALAGLLAERYSCRGFRSDSVPRATIEHILGLAQRTASWWNAQPWQLVLTSGAATARFREGLLRHAREHAAAPDFAFPREYRHVYLARRRECGFQLYAAVGVARGDRAGAERQRLENFHLFGAPHVAIVTSEEALGDASPTRWTHCRCDRSTADIARRRQHWFKSGREREKPIRQHDSTEGSARKSPALTGATASLIAQLHRLPSRTEDAIQPLAARVRQLGRANVAELVDRVQRLGLDLLVSDQTDADQVRRHDPVPIFQRRVAEDKAHKVAAAAGRPDRMPQLQVCLGLRGVGHRRSPSSTASSRESRRSTQPRPSSLPALNETSLSSR